jgi:hypothetical protein
MRREVLKGNTLHSRDSGFDSQLFFFRVIFRHLYGGDSVIVELTTLMVFNGSMHGCHSVTMRRPFEAGYSGLFFFLIRVMNTGVYEKGNFQH